MKQLETDIVVVGYGGAGGIAAITANDCGAEVLILEKAPFVGGNTICAGGNIMIAKNSDFVPYMLTLAGDQTDAENTTVLAEGSAGIPDWIRSMGGSCSVMVPHPPFVGGAGYEWVPGAEHMDKWNVDGDPTVCSAQNLMELIKRNVDKRGIRFMLDTPVTKLVQAEDGRVTGVIAESADGPLTVTARRAVILTCGGYEADEAMKRDYLPFTPVTTLGTPYNTGDGIRMSLDVGADLWHMGSVNSGVPAYKHPDFPASFPIMFRNGAVIYVDHQGKRFFDEKEGVENHGYGAPINHFSHKTMSFERNPMYAIFDDQNMNKPLFPPFAGYNKFIYKWSTDNRTELEKGWFKSYATLDELAADLDMDAESVKSSVSGFNYCAREGKADEFGRRPETMQELKGGPWYAMPLYLGLFSTQGGPRRDKDCHVLNREGEAIPGLYAAGELGSVIGRVYQGGSAIAESIVFGQIAGKHAAAEK